jgi:hypothetical protein
MNEISRGYQEDIEMKKQNKTFQERKFEENEVQWAMFHNKTHKRKQKICEDNSRRTAKF